MGQKRNLLIICRKCGAQPGSWPKLKQHYDTSPGHRLPNGEWSIEALAKRNQIVEVANDKVVSEVIDVETNGKQLSKRKYPLKKELPQQDVNEPAIKYCPHCGAHIEFHIAIANMTREIKL